MNYNLERHSMRSYMETERKCDHVLSCYRVGQLDLCGAAVNCGLTRQLHTRGWFNRTSLRQAPTSASNFNPNNSANWHRGMVSVWPGDPMIRN